MATDFALRAALEAILTVAETPLNLVTLAGALEVPIAQVKSELEGLVAEYETANDGLGRGFELREVGGGWRLYVRPQHDWAVKLKTGAPTTDDVAAFHAWRNQSPAHALAWSQACQDWKTVGQAAQVFEQRYPQKLRRPQRARPGRRMFFGAAASAFGALAVVSVVRPPLGLWPSWSELQADYRTGTGEQRELAPYLIKLPATPLFAK